MCDVRRVFLSPASCGEPRSSTTLGNEQLTDLHLFIAETGHSWAGRCMKTCVHSSAMATSDISCRGCKFDYWEIIAPAVPVEDSELNDNREEDIPQPGPSSFR
ncbi:hypothetical protein E2C01_060877 [Portunus trituberculatus]|uniref:Uncharacterized protein n=1 Tax=Portunus trituberculatus TaxID=210409 RepID=A0A5B7HAU6_PORTR|nr:hypothetical protein [Portunus trituberculatus]